MHNIKNKLLARPSYYIGNFLMLSAVALLVYIYHPFVSVYLFPSEVSVASTSTYSEEPVVTIPKIGAQSSIVENVDPWNQTEYNESLEKGVAHAKDTSLPGEEGTVYLFAHSSDSPLSITRYNTAFFRLGELDAGDTIYIERGGKLFTYQVEKTLEVWPDETEYLTEPQGDVLILQTCTPLGTSLKRLLVFAKPVEG